MTTTQIFNLALKLGMKADPRGKEDIKEKLATEKRTFRRLTKKEQAIFDKEKLTNPYPDSRIHYLANKNDHIKHILTGIDIDDGEIILADRLKQKGRPIDLCLGHHPIGASLSNLHRVMDMLANIYSSYGVPIHVAEELTQTRVDEIGLGVHPINHFRPVDIAKLLNINLINIHTPCDNMVTKFIRSTIKEKKPKKIRNILNILYDIPEYKLATSKNAGPILVNCHGENTSGKIFIDMTGGTNPNDKLYEEISKAGISTIIGMHMRDEGIKLAKKFHLNIIIAGHIASDSLGLNLFLDILETKGIEIIPCSGLIRVCRNKTKKNN